MSKMMSGTGLVKYKYDYEKEKIGINFSGESAEGNYRNDASILFYAANNYRHSYYILEKELNKYFSEEVDIREISHIVLPLLFNFRHYVELEIKAFIVALTNESPKAIHALDILFGDLKIAINAEYDNCLITDRKSGLESVVSSIIKPLDTLIKNYTKTEPAVEYYRYIFEIEYVKKDKYLVLKNPIIEVDFKSVKDLFNSIIGLFNDLRLELNRLDYYIYYYN